MLLKEAKCVLEEAGLKVQDVKSMKGSCTVKGLSIGDGQIKPTIYEQTVSDMDADELVSFIDNTMGIIPEINLALAHDREYVLDHCFSCIRHRTEDERAVKWEVYGDLEEYVRLDLGSDSSGNNMSAIVTYELMKLACISEKELRHHARKNLKDTVKIQSMTEVLSGLRGDVYMPEANMMMYVASNESRINGAAVILLDDVLKDFCNQHNLDSIYIIPSSLHEVILISTQIPLIEIDSMIQEVNATQVDPWDQLSDHVYTFVA